MHSSDLFDLQIVGSDQGADEQDTKNAETPSEEKQGGRMGQLRRRAQLICVTSPTMRRIPRRWVNRQEDLQPWWATLERVLC